MKKIEHDASVISVEGTAVRVQIVSDSACASCHVKHVCGTGEKKEKIVTAQNTSGIDVKAGDRVRVLISRSTGLKAVFLAYLLPVFILISTLLILNKINISEPVIGLLSLGFVVVYYIFLTIFRDQINRKIEIEIEKINW